jgi:hypothetical protein
MRVDAPSLFNIAGDLHVQTSGARRLGRSKNDVQALDSWSDDIVSRRSDPEKIGKLADLSKVQHALISALRTNRHIEDNFLLDAIR